MSQQTDRTAEHVRASQDKDFAFIENTWTPWATLPRPLNLSRVALVSTGGLYLKRWQAPFDTDSAYGDWTFREFPSNVEAEDLAVAHDHYDHRFATADVNVVFPLWRLIEMQHQGVIGAVAPLHYTVMGHITRPDRLLADAALQIAWRLKQANTDAALLVAVSPLCHQTAGLMARLLECAGICTVCLGVDAELFAPSQPPRSVIIANPFGCTVGEPNNAPKQAEICRDTLHALAEAERAGFVRQLPYRWSYS